MTEQEAALVKSYLDSGLTVFQVWKKTGIETDVINDHFGLVTLGRWEPISEDGYGRHELREFIVARKHVELTWPVESHSTIAKARIDYDAGLTEICSARDGCWVILYAIPRKEPEKGRTPYFSRVFE